MVGIPSVSAAVLGRIKKMISKTQLQFLQSWNRPYLKTQWEYCEEFHKYDPLKWYMIYMGLPAYCKLTWADSFGLEELNYG
jgi:hypothetical protein